MSKHAAFVEKDTVLNVPFENVCPFFQDLFFKYTWNNFLHLQVELCVAAILRPCAHEMRLQPGLGSQEKIKPHQDASQEQALTETPSEPPVTPENSAHNLMVTHVGVSACV